MSLKDQIDKARKLVRSVEEQRIAQSQVVVPMPARSYASSTAQYDDDIGFTPDYVLINKVTRPMWRTQDVAVQQNKVITTNFPVPVTATGVAVSPSVSNTTPVAMPDMAVPVKVGSNTRVQISWNFSGSLSTSTASGVFVLYRDNLPISPQLYGSHPANNGLFSVSQTFIDAPGPGLHSYSVRWGTTAGTLTADGKGRVLSAQALKPQ